LLSYNWQESKSGPPRKYYSITETGEDFRTGLMNTWDELYHAVKQSAKPARKTAKTTKKTRSTK